LQKGSAVQWLTAKRPFGSAQWRARGDQEWVTIVATSLRYGDLGNSSQCKRPLIEIDHCGKRLIGCVECNRWGWPGSDHLFMALPEDDLQA
jgi:hypothetical protein